MEVPKGELISVKPVYLSNKNTAYAGHKAMASTIRNSGISGVNPNIKEPTSFTQKRYTSEASKMEGLR